MTVAAKRKKVKKMGENGADCGIQVIGGVSLWLAWIRPFAPARTGTTTASADSRRPFPMRRRMGSRFSTRRRASRDKTYVCASVRCGFTLTVSSEISGVSVHGRLTRPSGLRIRFLFVASEFCRRLPSHPASLRRTCLGLAIPFHHGSQRTRTS
jgi:hypothetical protein